MQKKVSKSFFDDTNSNASFWDQTQLNVDDSVINFQGLLFHKSKKTGFWASQIQSIIYTNPFLQIKKNQQNLKSNSSLDLNLSRIEIVKYKNNSEKDPQNKKKYGIRFIRNQQYKELYARTKELCLQWFELLKQEALQLTFKEDYSLQKMVGKGNFAKVFQATKKKTKQQFAVKAFEKAKLTNGDVDRKALLKEITIMRKLNHKGIIKMHEAFEDEFHIFIVQDLLEGGELYFQIKKNNKLTESQVARMISTLLESIAYLHEKNILHRDIKPENMILRQKGVLDDIVIADFGLADFYDPLGNYMFQRCGTPGFVAPEVLQDKIYDSKVDVFSVGCLMFVLLAGCSPFKGTTYDEVVMRNYNCKIDYPSIENKVSPQCKKYKQQLFFIKLGLNLLKWLLHPKPSQRYSCKDALKHEWFLLNLDGMRYKELNIDAHQQTRDNITCTTPTAIIKNFCVPVEFAVKQEYSTPQTNSKQPVNKQLMTPQINVMQQIQEQINDDSQDFMDQFDIPEDEEIPQSFKLPQYQIIGKLKQVVDSNNSSQYASPIIKNTPEIKQAKQIQSQRADSQPIQIPNSLIANKILANLRTFEN